VGRGARRDRGALRSLAAADPETILPLSYAGTMGMVQYASMDRRFCHRLGASLLDRTLCSSAGKAGIKATLGGSVGMDPERFDEAKLIILWGANPIVSNLHLWSRVQEPSAAARRSSRSIPIAAFGGEMHAAHRAAAGNGRRARARPHARVDRRGPDRSRLHRPPYVGFDELADRVAQYTPEWTARTCGLDVGEIVQLAREYRTGEAGRDPAQLRHAAPRGGGIAARNIACLPALTGAWRDAAGGIVLTTADFYSFNHAGLERPDPARQRAPARRSTIPALGDALYVGAAAGSRRCSSTTTTRRGAVPDSAKVVAGFMREDLFCVVMDSFLTDTADYADIVLPATTQLEHYDIHKSYGHLYVLANNPAIAPVGESLPNSEVFRRLAARMGFDEPCFKDSDEDICRTALESSEPRMRGVEWEAVKDSGWQRLDVAERFAPFAEGNFPTPSGKCELKSSLLAAQGWIRCLSSTRRPSRWRATRISRSAIRSRSCRRPRAISSTRASPT
jgi:anaerobic selenocysteine-containing dehydrogenase